MDEPVADPKWGTERRREKAVAIFRTVEMFFGEKAASGGWLDVGCGNGEIAATLANYVARVTGVDPEAWTAWTSFAGERVVFRVSRFDLELEESFLASADVVVCNQVYEHVSNPIGLIENIFRSLRPGGMVYFAGPNLLWPVEPHVFWLFVHWLPRRAAIAIMRAARSSRVGDLDAYAMHYWALTGALRAAGFLTRNALKERLLADAKIPRRIRKVVARVPRFVFDIFAPFSPGFVFILKKQ